MPLHSGLGNRARLSKKKKKVVICSLPLVIILRLNFLFCGKQITYSMSFFQARKIDSSAVIFFIGGVLMLRPSLQYPDTQLTKVSPIRDESCTTWSLHNCLKHFPVFV